MMTTSADSMILRAFARRSRKPERKLSAVARRAHDRVELARARAIDAINSLQSLDDTIDYLIGMRDAQRDTLRNAMPPGQRSSAKIAPGYTITVNDTITRSFCLCHGRNATGCPLSGGIGGVDPMGIPFPIHEARVSAHVRVERPDHETAFPALPFGAMAHARRDDILSGTWEDDTPIFEEAA